MFNLFTTLTHPPGNRDSAARQGIQNSRPGHAKDDLRQAIAHTSRKEKISFDYLLNLARKESGLNTHAKSKTSSASGAFQFINETWMGLVRQHGEELGLSQEANAIEKRTDGSHHVPDDSDRRRILALRQNPEISALVAAKSTQSNERYLQSALNRRPLAGELYLAHFLGPRQAVNLLRLAEVTPKSVAADHFPQAARANRAIFYTPGGPSRSASEVVARLAKGFGNEAISPGNYLSPPMANQAILTKTLSHGSIWSGNASPSERSMQAEPVVNSGTAIKPRWISELFQTSGQTTWQEKTRESNFVSDNSSEEHTK